MTTIDFGMHQAAQKHAVGLFAQPLNRPVQIISYTRIAILVCEITPLVGGCQRAFRAHAHRNPP
jgi:hypothetical protein